MSKGNNQRGRYNALNIRLAKYVALVQAVYDTLNQQAANITMMTGYDGSKEFHFSDFPQVREAVQRLQQDYVQSMQAIIYRGTSDEWKQSNLVQDLLADKILGKYSSKSWGRKHEVYYQTNSDALKAFQQRKDNGMGLSQRIWNMSGNYKEELEYSISTAIQKGTSAVQLSKKLSKYLNDFPSLKKDYKEKYGKAVDCHDCEYRSIRLARSEINMAYRSAEQTRWRQMDFVLGYEIKLSKKHKKDSDICDDLAGQYPKDFVWTGWHPNDLCYVIPILKTEEEFWHDEDTPPINQTKPVTEFPSGFNEYMEGHLDKISISNQKGTLSYWLSDNEDVKGCALLMNKAKQVGNVVQDIAERIAGEHGAIVTPINYKGFASLYRKVHYADQYGVRTALTEVKDSVRNTIVLDGDLDSVIKDLAKDSHWLRTKVQTADKFCGYSGNIVNLTMDNGVVAEIQVNTPKMIFAKESEKHARAILGDELYDKIAKETGMEGGLGHKLYEQIRVLDKVADAEKKASLEKQMRDYYSHFHPKAKSIEEIVEDKIKELSNFDKDEVREVFYFGDKAGIEMSKYRQLLTSDKFDIKKFKDYYYSDEDKIGKLEDSYENLRDRVNKELYLAGYEFRSYYQPLIDRFDKTPFAIYKSSKDYTDELIAIEKEVKKLNKKILYTPLRAEEYGKYTAIGKLTLPRLNNATLEEINHYVERLDTIIGEKERPGMSLEFKLQRKDLNKVLTTQVKDPNTLLRFYDFWQSDGGAVWDCVDHLHELVNATDLDKIPRRWRYEFNKLTKELTAENIKGNGVLYYYRHIEGAYNIYKLSTMKECVDFGLSRLSTKTPWNLCKIYVDNKWDLKDLPLKGFFDKENWFTPLYDRNVKNHFNVFSDAYFMPGYQHVCINKSYFSSSGRGAKSLYERKNICYHEFGHALDDDKMFSEELKPVYREYAKKLNDGQDQKIRAKFWKTFDDMLDKAPNQAAIEMIQEEVASVSDVIQAMLDDHEMWFGGHSGTYFERESNQLAEVVAHMSENYWWGNDFFKKVWPEFYSALYQVAKKCFK